MSPPEIERAITDLRDEALDLARRLSCETMASESEQQCLDAAVHVQAVANMLGDAQRLLGPTMVGAVTPVPPPAGRGTSA